MTLEEIRREKKVAEEAVQSILAKLAERTGLTPTQVNYGVFEDTSLGAVRQRQLLAIGPVTITLEGI